MPAIRHGMYRDCTVTVSVIKIVTVSVTITVAIKHDCLLVTRYPYRYS